MDLERHLYDNGTRIIKFFLHLSKEEQRKRFLQRIDEPEKNWKFGLADIEERKFWKQYMRFDGSLIASKFWSRRRRGSSKPRLRRAAFFNRQIEIWKA